MTSSDSLILEVAECDLLVEGAALLAEAAGEARGEAFGSLAEELATRGLTLVWPRPASRVP